MMHKEEELNNSSLNYKDQLVCLNNSERINKKHLFHGENQ